MKIAISKIKVTARIRKEVNKIEELAECIREQGLITPIAVMSLDGGEFQLLAGLRRLRAMELNGETEIDAKVFPASDAEAALKIEYFENDQREPFTFSEEMDYTMLIEEIEKAKAKERQAEGQALGGTIAGHGRSKNSIVDCGPQCNSTKTDRRPSTRDIVGSKINMSGRQYDRAKYVAANAPPEVIDQIDRGERKVRGVYNELRAKENATMPSTTAAPLRTETKQQIEEQPEAQTRTQTAAPLPKPSTSVSRPKNDPFFEKLKAEESEAIRKRREFDSLSPEEKIADLQRQLKEANARATDAESTLAREKELRQNAESHLGATIEMLNNQLAAAHERIRELEVKYESN